MNSGYQAIRINAAGTTVQHVGACVFDNITPDVSVGTIRVFDTNLASGTSAAKLRLTLTGGTAIQDCFTRTPHIEMRDGVVTAAEGTPIATLAIG